MLKSAKKAIQAIVGKADINDEEFMTAIIRAKVLINSRPVTYQSANPADDVPLTPNHFLHGQAGVSLHQPPAMKPISTQGNYGTDTGTSAPFLEQIDGKMVTWAQRTTEMVSHTL